jgi:predicted HAD superfamily Cof-like phosphohydrolase
VTATIREQVSEFHRAFDQPVLDTPTVPPDERVRLRLRLVLEEAFELIEACGGLRSPLSLKQLRDDVFVLITRCGVKVDLVAAADALADLDYVVEGTRLEFGIDGAPIAAEVHRSNMAKVWPDGSVKKNDDGKVLKPDGWTPPDIRAELVKQHTPAHADKRDGELQRLVRRNTELTLKVEALERALNEGATAVFALEGQVAELNRLIVTAHGIIALLARELAVLKDAIQAPHVGLTSVDETRELRGHVTSLLGRLVALEREFEARQAELGKRVAVAEEAIVAVTKGLLLR